MPRIIVLIAALCLSAGMARASETAALINQELDKQFQMEISTQPLPKVMERITAGTGVRIEAQNAVWELLPWGRDTNVGLKIEHTTLREALTRMTQRLGLTWVLKDESIEIQPMPALRRLAQRASLQEVDALHLLATTPLELGTQRPTIRQLLEAVDLKLAGEKRVQVAVENRIADAIPQDKAIFVPRNSTLMEALESVHKQTTATWYPWGRNIVVMTKSERTRALLAKPLEIAVNERGMEVMQLLGEIAARTGVPFEFQPGVIQTIPADARTIRGVIRNAPAEQVLQAVSASTGLIYTVQDDKVHVSSRDAAGAGNLQRDPLIGFLQLDNGMQILVPRSQVPPDILEYLGAKLQKEWDKIREQMQDEGFKPTTQPAKTGDEDL